MKNATGELRPFLGRINIPHSRQIAAHAMSCAKLALPFIPVLLLTVPARAAGTIDLTGFTTMIASFQGPALLVGSILTLISLIFSVFGFAQGNIVRGLGGVFGAIIGGTIIGLGAGWISSLTGQTVG